MIDFFPLLRPILHRIDAEAAHRLTIDGLKLMPIGRQPRFDARLAIDAFGLTFPSPLGLAAGFDKDAEVADAMLSLGLGFVEVGGVTPLPQAGNAKPRAFRLMRDRAVINRYGLNNAGGDAMRARLLQRKSQEKSKCGIVGVNIGANKDSADRSHDYAALVEKLCDVADYISVNISSPNTPGLRSLQDKAQLDALLAGVMAARGLGVKEARACPILVKIAPDIDLALLDDIVSVARSRGVDGLIVSNTTIARPGNLMEKTLAIEAGGLSGKPLFNRSTALLAHAYLRAEGAFPIVGVGGIDSVETAWSKIEAGASLLQLYTALVFEGPKLIHTITDGLLKKMDENGIRTIAGATGRKAAEWATRSLVA